MKRKKWSGFFRGIQSRISFVVLMFLLTTVFSLQLSAFAIYWDSIFPNCAYAIHQSITRNGLRNTQGLSWEEIQNIADYSKAPDVDATLPPWPDNPEYHFDDILFETDYLYTIGKLNQLRINAAASTHNYSPLSPAFYHCMGYIFHMTEDLFAHTQWVVLHPTLGDLPDLYKLNPPPAWDPGIENLAIAPYSYDCAKTPEYEHPLWHIAVGDAELMAGYQFQFYLKEVYKNWPDEAEANVNQIFPNVKDLKPAFDLDTLPTYRNANQSHNINWNNFADEPVTVQLLKNGVLIGSIAEVPAIEWHTTWKIEEKINNQNILPDSGYHIRLLRGNKCGDGDPFEITGILLTTPVANTSWKLGSTQTITINSNEILQNPWRLFLLNEQGERIGQIDAGIDLPNETNTLNYQWQVGKFIDGPDAEPGLYRIECSANAGQLLEVFYSGFFMIDKPTITVLSPNGGENWDVSSNQNITWNWTGTIANVKIEYSTDNGSFWKPVINSTPNDGSHLWTIPNDPSNTCLVRISNALDFDSRDISNANFSIIGTIKPDLVVTGIQFEKVDEGVWNAYVTVKNQGLVVTTVGKSVRADIQIQGNQSVEGYNAIQALAIGQSATIDIGLEGFYPGASFTGIAVVDKLNNIIEANETNNLTQKAFAKPDPPALLTPANNFPTCSTTQTFTWRTDAEAEPEVDYSQFKLNNADGTQRHVSPNRNVANYTPPAGVLQNGKNYTWLVRSYNALGWSAWSTSRSIQIGSVGLPGQPSLTSPAGGATITSLMPTLKWSAVVTCPAVDYYDVQLNAVDGSDGWVFEHIAGVNYQVPAGSLVSGKTYEWFVRAHNAQGWGNWSARRTFRVQLP